MPYEGGGVASSIFGWAINSIDIKEVKRRKTVFNSPHSHGRLTNVQSDDWKLNAYPELGKEGLLGLLGKGGQVQCGAQGWMVPQRPLRY
jgi:hypothetical protein